MPTLFQDSTGRRTPSILRKVRATGGALSIALLLVTCAAALAADDQAEENKSLVKSIADRVRFFATIELEAIYEKDFENKSNDDHEANFDLEVQVEIFDWLWGKVLYARDQSVSEFEDAYVTLFDTGDRRDHS